MKVLITGGAGFIGSNLTGALLQDERIDHVRVLDNLLTGNFDNIREFVGHPKFEFIEGDICDFETCLAACAGMDLISHQAALGSVPRSVKDPVNTNRINLGGTLNVFTAARDRSVRRIVFASSSSVYGDHPGLPKVESEIGAPLSPYAVSKRGGELYARVFQQLYSMEMVGLRYFNVFGPNQSPQGPYAAVIPLFVKAILSRQSPTIHGDGLQSRDFTYVDNVVQANKLALFSENAEIFGEIFNIAYGGRCTLLELFETLKRLAGSDIEAIHVPERAGDIKHSLADTSKARNLLGFSPQISLEEGLRRTLEWSSQRMDSLFQTS